LISLSEISSGERQAFLDLGESGQVVGAVCVLGKALVTLYRPAWGKRMSYGREFPEQYGGWLPDWHWTFWGWGSEEEVVEFARENVGRLLEQEVSGEEVACTQSSL